MKARNVLIMAVLLSMAPLAQAKEALPFIDNDYAKAVASAKAKHLPLFVDAWAPW